MLRCAKDTDISRDLMQPLRGRTDEQWGAAAARLAERGWIGEDRALTAVGRAAHDAVEAASASDKVPADRPMDGIDASAFLLGRSKHTGRENILFFGPDGSLMSSKWHNVKGIFRYCDGIDQPILEPQFPMFFDLGSDPGERYNLMDHKLDMGWMFGIALSYVAEYKKSIARYPNIKPGQQFNGHTATVPVQGADTTRVPAPQAG